MRKRNGMLLCILVLLVVLLAVGLPTSFATAGYTQLFNGSLKHSAQDKATPRVGKGTDEVPPFVAQPFLPRPAQKLSLNVARRNHTATTLTDGRVVIIGGENLAGTVSAAEMLDPVAATITLADNSLTPRAKHTATLLLNGKVLISGGANEAGVLNSTELFDPQTGAFSEGARLQRARAGHSATLLANGQVLFAGGQADDTAEIYDPATNRSVLINGKLTAVRSGHSAVLLKDGNVLLTGGEAGGGHAFESAEIFNPSTQRFATTANEMLIPRARATLRVLPDGKVQVIGGDHDSTMEIYDPVSGRFTALAHLAPTAEIFDRAGMLSAQTRTAFVDARGYRDPQIKRPNAQKLKAALNAFQEQEVGRLRYAMTEIPGRGQAALVGGTSDDRQLIGSALLLSSSAATVSTSKAQYLPGEAAVITGTGWQPGETVTVIRQEANLGHKRTTLRAVADKRGEFICTDLTASDYQVWTSYTLTARGQASEQVAQTTYFDAPLPGKEKESLPQVLKYHIPITTRDGSVETETVMFKWRTDSAYVEQENLVNAANAASATGVATCTVPNGSLFNFRPSFSDVINQPCLGINPNPCGVLGAGGNDVQFTSACLSFTGGITAEYCLFCLNPYAKISIQEDFKGGGTLKFDLRNDGFFNLATIPIPGLNYGVTIPGLLNFAATVGLHARAKVSVDHTTDAAFEVPFELSQGNEFGFDSRLSDPFFNTQTTPSGATGGPINVTKPGTASAKVSFGPSLSLVVGPTVPSFVDFGVGILGFVQVALTEPTDTTTCKSGKVDLFAGVDGDASAKLIGLFNYSGTLPAFSKHIDGFPKTYVSLDTAPPVISPISNIIVAADTGVCGGTYTRPTINAMDDCSGVDMSTLTFFPATTFLPPGMTTVTARVKDFGGNEATATFTVTVTCPTISSLSPATLPDAMLNVSYNQSVQALPAGNYSYSLTAGFLPPGIFLNGAGGITGTTNQPGTYTFTITASLCAGCSFSQTYTINVVCPTTAPTMSPASLPSGAVLASYSQDITVSPSGSYSFAVTQGALPSGLSFNQVNGFTYRISGTPTEAGTFNFVVTATSSNDCGSVARTYSITVACPTLSLTPTTLPGGAAGNSYEQTLTASPTSTDYVFAHTGGTLPPGLQLQDTGALTGRLVGNLTTPGTYNFTITATGYGVCPISQTYTITVTCPTITLSAATFPNGTAGVFYLQDLITAAPGGIYSFAVTGGNLPPGLDLISQGGAVSRLIGTPIQPGTYDFTVTATGFGNCTGSRSYRIIIVCPTITFPALPKGMVGELYTQHIYPDPITDYIYGVTAGNLPPGLVFDPTPTRQWLIGTPTQSGTFNFTMQVTGFGSCSATHNYSLVIECPPFDFLPLPGAVLGTAYNQKVTNAVGGYTLSLTGNLPSGLSFDPVTGALTGTPTTLGTFNFAITATGPGNCTQRREYTVTVVCPTFSLTPTTLPNGVQGTAYNQTLAVTPTGTGYSYAVTTNVLPPGLSLNSATGALTGTPTAPGNYTFVITVTGLGVCTKSQSYNVAITGTCPTITVNPASLPGGTVGTAYNQTISATGGTAPYSFAVTQGALPAGLTMDAATGVISGTPAAGGAASFRITTTGQGGCTGARQYVVNITCAALSISPSTTALPGATRGVAYSQAITVTPAASYNFSLMLGQLPPGFTMNSGGVISGVTTQTGTYSFTLKVTGGSCQTTKSYTLTVTTGLTALAQLADYDGDGKSDFALSSSQGAWKLLLSGGVQRQTQTLNLGTAGDLNLLGDYDGDGLTDLAVFRPSDGAWHVKQSSDGSYLTKVWGVATDVPVPGDYDGDGKTDLAVFRPSDGHWYVLRSSDQQAQVTAWGAGYAPYHDVAVPGDYDGDGRTDLAVFRRATGTWLVQRSSDGKYLIKQWGLGTDAPVAADYDGDGQTDLAVWRQGTWYIWQSKTENYRVAQWGTSAAPYYDQAVPGDYDGDGQADLAVWRTSEQAWYVQFSLTGKVLVQTQGQSGDRPLSSYRQ